MTVSIDLDNNGVLYDSSTGTTGTDGTVTFKYPNAPSGTYTTEVIQVQGKGVEWDGGELDLEEGFDK